MMIGQYIGFGAERFCRKCVLRCNRRNSQIEIPNGTTEGTDGFNLGKHAMDPSLHGVMFGQGFSALHPFLGIGIGFLESRPGNT